jgi:hypothetical protein
VDFARIQEIVGELARDPRVQMGARAALLLLVVVLVVRGAGKRKRRAAGDSEARVRQKLLGGLRAFRDEVKRAAAGSEPVFRKIDGETSHASVIGHWRKSLRHRITVRRIDFGAMKGAARDLGLDSMPLSDLEAGWRKLERQIGEYNSGKMDDSTTPIATIRQFEKEFQKVQVLANIALKGLGG